MIPFQCLQVPRLRIYARFKSLHLPHNLIKHFRRPAQCWLISGCYRVRAGFFSCWVVSKSSQGGYYDKKKLIRTTQNLRIYGRKTVQRAETLLFLKYCGKLTVLRLKSLHAKLTVRSMCKLVAKYDFHRNKLPYKVLQGTTVVPEWPLICKFYFELYSHEVSRSK